MCYCRLDTCNTDVPQDGGSASLNLPLVRLLKHGAKPKTKSFCNFVEKVEGEERQDAKGEGLVLSV